MKYLLALSMLLTLSTVHAQSVESFFSPSVENQKLDRPNRPDRPQGHTRLFIQNNCYTDVYAVIQYKNLRNQTESAGFFRFFPGQIIQVTTMIERNYLLHAFTADNRIFWNGPYALTFQNRNYPAMMINLDRNGSGDWTSVLYCR